MLRTVAVILARLAWFMLIIASGVLLREPQLASSRAWMTLCIAGPLTFAVVFPRVVVRFARRASTPRLRLVGWLALGEIALLAVAVTYGVHPNGALPVTLAAFGAVIALEIAVTSLENRELDALTAAFEAHVEREQRLHDLTGP